MLLAILVTNSRKVDLVSRSPWQLTLTLLFQRLELGPVVDPRAFSSQSSAG